MAGPNPFEPPSEGADAGIAPAGGLRLHTVKLYSPNQVGIGTFLGTPIAGGWLMAANYKALGEPEHAQRPLLVSVAVTVALVALAFVLPEGRGASLAGIGLAFAARYLAQSSQGRAYANVLAAGGSRFSMWRVVGISIIAVLVFLALCFVAGLVIGTFFPESLEE